jgi:hypothetical protein
MQVIYTIAQANSIEDAGRTDEMREDRSRRRSAMLQDFWIRRRRRAAIRGLFATAWLGDDPLAHPALRAMNAAELADIPFPRPIGRPRR